MIIPELPAFLTSLGGEDYKGLIIALFTLTAGISRPFSGKLADTIGRVPIILFVCCSESRLTAIFIILIICYQYCKSTFGIIDS